MDDFCRNCGARIPPIDGEGTCRWCDPQGAINHMEEELTKSRAELARLQEELDSPWSGQWRLAFHQEERLRTAAEAQVSTLTAELDDLKAEQTRYDAMREAYMAKANQQTATLTAALRRHGQHLRDCKVWMQLDDGSSMVVPLSADLPDYVCTCGFDAVLRAASEGAP